MNRKQMLTAAKPHLAHIPQKTPVAVRITMGFSDERGVPINGNRAFVVTAATTRQTTNGARSSFAPNFDSWNGTPKHPIGKGSFTFYMGSATAETCTNTTFRCQQGLPSDPVPPGGVPFCTSQDGVTARRWTGQTMIDIPCLNAACPYLLGPGKCPCKPLTDIVGFITDDKGNMVSALLATQSGKSGYNLDAMLEASEAQWVTLHEQLGLPVPAFNWHAVPVQISIAQQQGKFTDGPRRYHRWHFALACTVEEMVARTQQTHAQIAAGAGQLPMLTAGDIEPSVQAASMADLNPSQTTPAPAEELDLLEQALSGAKLSHTQMMQLCAEPALPPALVPVLQAYAEKARAAYERTPDARIQRAIQTYEATINAITSAWRSDDNTTADDHTAEDADYDV